MSRILVIDDHALVRASLRMILRQARHEVLEARDGVEGLEVFRGRPCDLVLCDLLMPGKDGLDTIRELLREFPAVPVVAMSGGAARGGPNLLPAAEALGAVRLLEKPFGEDELLAAVEQVLAGRPAGASGS